jgi:medium-chain acyl-[acyl-carrier-protein] hydrolase
MRPKWLIATPVRHSAQIRLFCFPYAGGTASSYRTLGQLIPDSVELMAIQLPGRDERICEPPETSLANIVGSIVKEVTPYLDKPYATFGHSLGTILGYEVVKELANRRLPMPQHMVMSARGAPHAVQNQNQRRYLLPDDQFIEELRKLEGSPPELLQNRELMQLLLPSLRADFYLAESYASTDRWRVPCSMSVYGGTADFAVTRRDLEEWQAYSADMIKLRIFPGGHFFINSCRDLFAQVLIQDILGGKPHTCGRRCM